jgi:hypothetical protein
MWGFQLLFNARMDIFDSLGIPYTKEEFIHLVSTDEGFPADFKATLVRDIERRPTMADPLTATSDHWMHYQKSIALNKKFWSACRSLSDRWRS